jgi:DNA-binding CsgD family transcriptional regulator
MARRGRRGTGSVYFSHAETRCTAGQDRQPMSQPTARELEVLAAFLRHGSRKCAAAELGISDCTASATLAHLYAKLKVRSRSEAAIALGWLVVPSASAR